MVLVRGRWWLLLMMGLAQMVGAVESPTLQIQVVPAGQPLTVPHQPIVTLPTSGPVAVRLVLKPTGFTPTTATFTEIRPALGTFLTATEAATLSGGDASGVTANLPVRGVYQIRATATDGTTTRSTSTWIQAWDRRAGLDPLRRVGRNPGVLPPTSVRLLSPDPGPGQHPRLLFTDADWLALSGKQTTAANVASAVASLRSTLNGNFDKTATPEGSLRTLANLYIAYHDGAYATSFYTSSVLPAIASGTTRDARVKSPNLLGRSPSSALPDALLVAAYLAWTGSDPTVDRATLAPAVQARFTELAKIAAGFAKAELVYAGTSTTLATAAHDLALVYDLLYDWMTPAQRSTVRDYLYAIGYGWYNTGTGGLSRTKPASYRSNGNFPNLVDMVILSALAIEGEEDLVSSAITTLHGAPVPPVDDAWPGASPATVWNLERMNRWYSEYFVSAWGSPLEHHAYLELSTAFGAPPMLALARRGPNCMVTGSLYQTNLHAFSILYPRQSDGAPVLWDHHDSMGFGNGPNSNNGRYLHRYLFPDDPLVDYVHRAYRNEGSTTFAQALWDDTPGAATLAEVAAAKQIPLARLDPMRGAGTTRNSWDPNDLSLYFECRADVHGHMHAEANNFSLFALGRAWSSPPGYHMTLNDLSATVLVQDPALTGHAVTEGYLGQSASAAKNNYFPTPPARFLEASEDPAGGWTLFAGDARSAYQYGYPRGVSSTLDTGTKHLDFFYQGWVDQLTASERSAWESTVKVGDLNFNPMAKAFRTVLTVRGSHPYVVVFDDITVDGTTPRNWRWNMPCAVSFGPSGGRFVDASNRSAFSSLALQAGATATEAILYHDPIDAGTTAGLPRLLVRDVAPVVGTHPAIILDRRPVGDPRGNLVVTDEGNVPSNRLLITRENVASPGFQVLLYPYRTGETQPTTTWEGSTLVVTHPGGTDRWTIDTSASDGRTRVSTAVRAVAGHAAPTLVVPADLVVDATGPTAANGQPGAVVTYSVTAQDEGGAFLTPTLSAASGSLFPAGVHVITATATDGRGQSATKRFTVTVRPAPPTPLVVGITNLAGALDGIQLRWDPILAATTYTVERATSSSGPWTVASDRQTAYTFGETGLTDGTWYYRVSSWIGAQQGLTSTVIVTTTSTDPLTATAVGPNVLESGYRREGNRHLLTTKKGATGVWTDSMVLASRPWTGDGSFTTRLVSLTGFGANVSSFAHIGIDVRASTAASVVSAYSGLATYASTAESFYRTANGAKASPGKVVTPRLTLPVWFRLVRSGSEVRAYTSLDGGTWLLHDTGAVTLTGLPASTVVGLHLDAQNDTLTSAVFDNLLFLSTPVATSSSGGVVLNWAESLAASYTVERAAAPEGPFTTLVSGLTATTATDTTGTLGASLWYRITATSEDGATATSPAVLGRRGEPVTVTLTPVSVTADGLVHQPAITISPTLATTAALEWSWTAYTGNPSAGGVLDPSTTTLVPPTAAGWYAATATVSGTQTGSATTTVALLAGATPPIPVSVTPVMPSLTQVVYDGTAKAVAPTGLTLGSGDSLTVAYRAFTGDPSAGGVAVTGSSSTTLPPVEPGWYHVQATVVGAQAGTATARLRILRITPTVTWATPAGVPVGTVLGGSQLNATTATAGSWSYIPAAGTTLATAGSVALAATFTPTDLAHYEAVSTETAITVTALPSDGTGGTPTAGSGGGGGGGCGVGGALSALVASAWLVRRRRRP